MRKIEKGQLVLLCLPDYERSVFEKGRNEYAARTNDIAPASPSQKNTTNFKKANPVFEYEWTGCPSLKELAPAEKSPHEVFFVYRLRSCFLPFPGKPPQTIVS